MNWMRSTAAILLVSLLSGCAAIFNGTKDTIYVRSEEPDTKLFIDEVSLGKNSGSLSVSKKGDHYIRAVKEGCSEKRVAMTQSFDPTSLLGILLDLGLISMLIVDGAATGAISDFEPKQYVVTPDCPPSGAKLQSSAPVADPLAQ